MLLQIHMDQLGRIAVLECKASSTAAFASLHSPQSRSPRLASWLGIEWVNVFIGYRPPFAGHVGLPFRRPADHKRRFWLIGQLRDCPSVVVIYAVSFVPATVLPCLLIWTHQLFPRLTFRVRTSNVALRRQHHSGARVAGRRPGRRVHDVSELDHHRLPEPIERLGGQQRQGVFHPDQRPDRSQRQALLPAAGQLPLRDRGHAERQESRRDLRGARRVSDRHARRAAGLSRQDVSVPCHCQSGSGAELHFECHDWRPVSLHPGGGHGARSRGGTGSRTLRTGGARRWEASGSHERGPPVDKTGLWDPWILFVMIWGGDTPVSGTQVSTDHPVSVATTSVRSDQKDETRRRRHSFQGCFGLWRPRSIVS
ncbi:hypothetical protein VTK73DRAFT_717 [Phialemonium thermophilum]|uniref:Uncharacterized protein n=1 Tax=Phialemonium thermophilum TaxID=223376 RepID=A0ABR3VUE4_9PEZI